MKKLIFSGTGYPITIKTLQYLQDNALNAVAAIAKSKENYEVIWGMTLNEAGTQITNGAFAFNSEVIPFVGGAISENTTITINEIIDIDGFNTNPSNSTAVETLPAYSSKVAVIGTGGAHTFNVVQLKRYVNSKIIAKGVVGDADIIFGQVGIFEGAVVNVAIPEQTEPYAIQYTLRSQGQSSGIFTHENMIIDSHNNQFRIAIKGNRYQNRAYSIEWQISKVY